MIVNITYETRNGVRLGRWIAQIRAYKKSGIKSRFMTANRIADLDKIGMVWDVPDYLCEQNYYSALQYYRKKVIWMFLVIMSTKVV